MKNTWITLDWNELSAASHIGALRKVSSLKGKREDKAKGPSDWNIDMDGAAAELAVAKYLNVFCIPSINTFKAPDVAGYQVRSTNRVDGHLIVRPLDGNEETFILVITDAPRMRLVGTYSSFEAKDDKFWNGDSWWVPQDVLHDLPEAGRDK